MRGDDTLRWFRLYSDIVDNHKIRMIDPAERWFFIGIMACECQGILHGDDMEYMEKVLAIKLEVSVEVLRQIKQRLISVRLIDDQYQPVGWDERQYKSDSSTSRVARHRARKAETLQQRSRNVTVTPPEQNRTEHNQNRKEHIPERVAALGVEPGLWNEYLATRKRLKATNTERAINTLVKKLEKLVAQGATASDVVEQANAQGWKTVYMPKEEGNVTKSAVKIAKHTNW